MEQLIEKSYEAAGSIVKSYTCDCCGKGVLEIIRVKEYSKGALLQRLILLRRVAPADLFLLQELRSDFIYISGNYIGDGRIGAEILNAPHRAHSDNCKYWAVRLYITYLIRTKLLMALYQLGETPRI